MAALALALESELPPTAALQLSRALEIVRRSSKFSPPQRVAAKMHVARLGWALVTEARKEKGGTTASSNLRDAMKAVCGCIAFATSGAPKVETATSAVEACKRAEDAWSAAKGGDAGGRGLAVEGRGDQQGQGDKLAGTDAGTRVVSVVAGGGRRGPPAGAGRPAARNPQRPGERAGRSGRLAAWGPTPALSAGVAFRALHLTGSGRLWVPRSRLLLLRGGGQVDRRGRRS
jgi:hypothetical protein